MLVILAALMIVSSAPAEQPFDASRTAWIFSTVGHSEFCPSGHVRLDLRTGSYDLTARAPRRICNNPKLERPVTKGMLGGARLTAIRAAYMRVLREGLQKRICEEGGMPEEIIVTNSATPTLVIATGAAAGSAPDDLSCWSGAARELHKMLDEAFRAAHQR